MESPINMTANGSSPSAHGEKSTKSKKQGRKKLVTAVAVTLHPL